MAKDKKGKSEGKKAKAAEKKQKQEKKSEKKAKVKASKQDGDDVDDVDIDAVLEEYQKQQEQFLKVTETVADGPPKARAASCFLASPANTNQLLLFGGEYFNGALASFFNDLHVYYIDRDEWRTVTSPNAPLPRSGHAWCRGGNMSNSVFLFGGEFSSPKQGTFYHYNDFWLLDPSSREWSKVESSGKTPPARSGHRMTYFKQYIILFGGFQDTANQTRYLGDLWIYDTANFKWFNPTLPPAQLKPDPRSSFTLLPHENGAVLYGGYSRVKATSQAGRGGASKNTMKAVIHQDCFFLRITPPAADAAPGTAPTVRWERRKKPANTPNPTRAGATMAYHRGRGIMFGGVHDVEENDESVESEFFNHLYAWNIDRNRFFPLGLRKARAQPKKAAGDQPRVGRRNRAQANEDELLAQLAALEASSKKKNGGDSDDESDDEAERKAAAAAAAAAEEEAKAPVREMPVSMELPHMRFNSLLTVQDDVLYIYGGTYEKGDREFTFDDMYAIDLGKMDGCKEVYMRPLDETWIDSEDEDEDDEDDEYEDYEDSEEDVEMEDDKAKKFTPSARKKKPEAEGEADKDKDKEAAPEADDDTEADGETPEDDGLPHPRPFESRRDFFNRTSTEWQEILMLQLRWKNVRVEDMLVKEIKTKAFELSEEKWWDCREEITALEDEQEASGIGEVVSLADRGEGTGGAAGAPRRR